MRRRGKAWSARVGTLVVDRGAVRRPLGPMANGLRARTPKLVTLGGLRPRNAPQSPTCVCVLLRRYRPGLLYGHERPLRGDDVRVACVADGSGPGFRGGHRQLTLASRTIASRVNFLAPPRTHTGGHKQTMKTDSFQAF